jgi:hypothetical protein
VELLVHSQHEAFERYDRMLAKHDASQARNDASQASNDEAMGKTQHMLAQVVESIDSLARIAHSHEHRISGLEEGRA